jgi:hypothetical protein
MIPWRAFSKIRLCVQLEKKDTNIGPFLNTKIVNFD